MKQITVSHGVSITLMGSDYVSSTSDRAATIAALIRAVEAQEAKAKELRRLLGQVVRAK